MNLADPELELLDPTPNVHSLFLHFDSVFFWTKLASRAVVRWSKRMYSCAGICSYEGRGGLCDIALSEPLLKLRPRKDLIETLLHEMIHAFLFVTGNDRDRDGHGPNFQGHMHRINKAAGLNISIYHSFHDEVKLYQTHWWRCNGPCQQRKPYFGMVRRSMNRAPGPSDCWWEDHQRKCGGNFIKIKEPEKKGKASKSTSKPQNTMGDITKFIDNRNKTSPKNVNTLPGNVFTKSNGGNTLVVTKKNVVFNPKSVKPKISLFDGKGYTVGDNNNRKSMQDNNKKADNVAETVRNVWLNKAQSNISSTNFVNDISRKVKEVWANKQLQSSNNTNKKNNKRSSTATETTPPPKIKKIDDYFKTTAAKVLTDIYGEKFSIYQKTDDSKIIPIQNPDGDLVSCPICKTKVKSKSINSHIDECLNKDEISRLVNDELPSTSKGDTSIINSGVIKKEPHHEIPTVKIDTETDIIPEIKNESKCPCCGKNIEKTIEEHLDECLAFFDNNTTIPEEGSNTSNITTIVIDDDDDENDQFDESLSLNATGTKSPCPVCLKMIEQSEMNSHLDMCLQN